MKILMEIPLSHWPKRIDFNVKRGLPVKFDHLAASIYHQVRVGDQFSTRRKRKERERLDEGRSICPMLMNS